MILEEIENAVPYQQIYIDKSQNKIFDEITDERMIEIESKAMILISMAMSLGDMDKHAIIQRLFLSEPFSKYPNLKEKLMSEEL